MASARNNDENHNIPIATAVVAIPDNNDQEIHGSQQQQVNFEELAAVNDELIAAKHKLIAAQKGEICALEICSARQECIDNQEIEIEKLLGTVADQGKQLEEFNELVETLIASNKAASEEQVEFAEGRPSRKRSKVLELQVRTE